jgi:hypothetical protein
MIPKTIGSKDTNRGIKKDIETQPKLGEKREEEKEKTRRGRVTKSDQEREAGREKLGEGEMGVGMENQENTRREITKGKPGGEREPIQQEGNQLKRLEERET